MLRTYIQENLRLSSLHQIQCPFEALWYRFSILQDLWRLHQEQPRPQPLTLSSSQISVLNGGLHRGLVAGRSNYRSPSVLKVCLLQSRCENPRRRKWGRKTIINIRVSVLLFMCVRVIFNGDFWKSKRFLLLENKRRQIMANSAKFILKKSKRVQPHQPRLPLFARL